MTDMRGQKNLPEQLKLSDFSDKSLLIVDDDDPLRGRLARAMEKKGFQVKEAKTVAEGLNIFPEILLSTDAKNEEVRINKDWEKMKGRAVV